MKKADLTKNQNFQKIIQKISQEIPLRKLRLGKFYTTFSGKLKKKSLGTRTLNLINFQNRLELWIGSLGFMESCDEIMKSTNRYFFNPFKFKNYG